MPKNNPLAALFSPAWKPEDNDVIIPIMGPTGAGKSTFINFIAGKDVTTVGHDLKSCTSGLLPVVIDSSSLPSDFPEGRRLVLVDTPGFGDTYVDNPEILQRIASWLNTMYKGETKLAGIVYIHDMSLTRMLGPISTSLDIFRKLCGKGALERVVFCTTKWSDIYKEEGERRIEQLKESHWKEMLEGGSAIHKFEDSQKSAQDVIAPIIEKDRYGKMDALQIQEELVEAGKLLADTEAGRVLQYTSDQLLKMSKQASNSKDSPRRKELDAQIVAIRGWAKEKHVPLTQHILRLLELFIAKILDISASRNVTPPNKVLVPAVGARLTADVKELIMLFGETEATYKRLLDLSPAKITIFGSEDVRCWSVERGDLKPPIFVVAAPSFDSPQGGNPAIFEKVRTWLSSSCREEMQFGIIFLRSSVHQSPSGHSHAGDLVVEQSGLKSNALFATFASKATATSERSEPSYAGPVSELVQRSGLESKTVVTLAIEETTTVERSEPSHAGPAVELVDQSELEFNALFTTFLSEATDTIEYGFDGHIAAPFQETSEQALKMFNIALSKPVSLDLLLDKLPINSEGATNKKWKGLTSRSRSLL